MARYTAQSTDDTFEHDVLDCEMPVLVDFYAPWCLPCSAMAPTLEALASRYQGRLKVVKVDVQENPAISRAMGIRGVPTLAVFKSGDVTEATIGAQSLEALCELAERAIAD